MKAMIVLFGLSLVLLLAQNYEAYDKTNFYELASNGFITLTRRPCVVLPLRRIKLYPKRRLQTAEFLEILYIFYS